MDTSHHKAAQARRTAQDSAFSTYRRPVQVLVYAVRWTDDGWRWTTYDEALDLLKWRENVQALECCHRALSDQVRGS